MRCNEEVLSDARAWPGTQVPRSGDRLVKNDVDVLPAVTFAGYESPSDDWEVMTGKSGGPGEVVRCWLSTGPMANTCYRRYLEFNQGPGSRRSSAATSAAL